MAMVAEREKIISMDKMDCAVCGPASGYRVLYPERFRQKDINLAARKAPRGAHYRIVKCDKCHLTYSTPIFSIEYIELLYKNSEFIQEPQLENMAKDYRHYLQKVLPFLNGRRRLLEIGCGNGFFLKEAAGFGFEQVWGVEPCKEAINRADLDIRPQILNAVFDKGLFEPGSFDVVCFFQVLDHIIDPNKFLQDVYNVLRKDGIILTINHNIRSLIPRILGERSSMYDIGHIFLFDPKTMRMILQKNNFEVITIENITNTYTIEYCLKMLPLPEWLRRLSPRIIGGLAKSKIRFRAGNMVSIARKGA